MRLQERFCRMTNLLSLRCRQRYWNKRHASDGKIWGEEPPWVAEDSLKILRSYEKIEKILVLGCGYGRSSTYFAGAGFEVVGVDFSKKAIEIGKNSVSGCLRVKYVMADVCKLPFPARFFDGIFAYHIFHLLLDSERFSFLGEMNRVLRKSGIVIVVALSVKDKAFRKGIMIEENTFDANNEGKPTHFFQKKEMLGYLNGYKIRKIDNINIFECHNGRPHTHSATRVIAQKEMA